MFPTPVFNRGVAYYKNDQVEDLLFDINHHVWTASVHGTEAYFVEVNLTNFENGSIRAYCDCPAFDTYDTCKHIVAVLLSVADQTANQTSEIDFFNYYYNNFNLVNNYNIHENYNNISTYKNFSKTVVLNGNFKFLNFKFLLIELSKFFIIGKNNLKLPFKFCYFKYLFS